MHYRKFYDIQINKDKNVLECEVRFFNYGDLIFRFGSGFFALFYESNESKLSFFTIYISQPYQILALLKRKLTLLRNCFNVTRRRWQNDQRIMGWNTSMPLWLLRRLALVSNPETYISLFTSSTCSTHDLL